MKTDPLTANLEIKEIPQVPIIRITPRKWMVAPNLRELWAYRELLYFLTLRDIKVRYKQTAIGIAWAVLQPVLTTAVFTVIFSGFARFDTGSVPYPLFVLSGLLIWTFTYGSVTTASNSFVSNTNLVTKVYFPRLIVPLAAIFGGLVDVVFSFLLLLILMVYYRPDINAHIFLAPVFMCLGVILTAALGIMFSAINVRFRDVKFALPFFLQVWMIASPVFYPASLLTGKWRLIFAVNPMTGVLEGFRSSLFGYAYDLEVIGISMGSILMLSLLSIFIFKQMEDSFADQI